MEELLFTFSIKKEEKNIDGFMILSVYFWIKYFLVNELNVRLFVFNVQMYISGEEVEQTGQYLPNLLSLKCSFYFSFRFFSILLSYLHVLVC